MMPSFKRETVNCRSREVFSAGDFQDPYKPGAELRDPEFAESMYNLRSRRYIPNSNDSRKLYGIFTQILLTVPHGTISWHLAI